MPAINEVAERGFTRGVTAYEKARPDYPAEAVEAIVNALAIGPASSIADVGAGTGKFTRALVATGAKLYAVEPLDAMRGKISLPGVTAIAAGAESIPLPTASLTGITVAQAFHWFDGPRAVAEFHRLLQRNGKVALIWNQRDLRVPWIAAVEAIVKPYENIQPHEKLHETVSVFTPSAGFTTPSEHEFAHVQKLDHEGVVTRVASISYIANLEAAEQTRVFDRVRASLKGLPTSLDFAYRTRVYVTTAI